VKNLYLLPGLKREREKAGLTQYQLAIDCFYECAYIRHIKRWEGGGRATVQTVERLADFFSVGMEDLADRDVYIKPPALPRSGIAKRLYYSRIKACKTQQECADAIGVCRPAYAEYERGDHPIRAQFIPILADMFDVTDSYLLRGEKDDRQ